MLETLKQPAACSIEPMQSADLAAVAQIERDSFSDPWTPANFSEGLNWEQSFFRVARQDGEVVGYLCTLIAAGEMHIANVAVGESRRGLGIGRALVEEGLNEARRRGCLAVWLDVRQSNRQARALYEQLGFRRVLVRQKYYRKPVEDAWVYCLVLSPRPGEET